MNSSNLTTPLEAVQVLSLFSYMSTLSDFLYNQSSANLSTDNFYQQLPTVNALYHYIHDANNNRTQKQDTNNNGLNSTVDREILLAKTLINGSDLYGAKYGETLEVQFVVQLYEYLINIFVFDGFTNVFGFIAEVVRNTDDLSLDSVIRVMKQKLRELESENEDNSRSQIDPQVIDYLFIDTIMSYFPYPPKDMKINCVEYIYAQAGLMFLRQGNKTRFFNNHTEEQRLENKTFEEYIAVGHMIEQSIHAEEMDMSALKVFTLPAVLHYVRKEKENLQNESIGDIMTNQTHLLKAHKLLFSYLNEEFHRKEKELQVQKYRYLFIQEMKKAKHRSQIARGILKEKCNISDVSNEPIKISKIGIINSLFNMYLNMMSPFERARLLHHYKIKNRFITYSMNETITDYENNADDFSCPNHPSIKLPDLNIIYKTQNEKVEEAYLNFVQESLKQIFDDEFKKSVANSTLEIVGTPQPGIPSSKNHKNLLGKQVLTFYFHDDDTYFICILRKNQLNITTRDVHNRPRKEAKKDIDYLSYGEIYKRPEESIDQFINNTAKKVAKHFREQLDASYRDQTWTEWFKDLALHLIPFYSCHEDIGNSDWGSALLNCGLDILILIPFIQDAYVFGKFAGSVVRTGFYEIAETEIKSLAIKLSFRQSLGISGKLVFSERQILTKVLMNEKFTNLGVSALRVMDPGFELLYSLGKGARIFLKDSIKLMKTKLPLAFHNLENLLLRSKLAVTAEPLKVGELSGKDVLVRSLGLDERSGFGVRFIEHDDRIVKIKNSKPVLQLHVTNDGVQVYKQVDFTKTLSKDVDLNYIEIDHTYNGLDHTYNELDLNSVPSIKKGDESGISYEPKFIIRDGRLQKLGENAESFRITNKQVPLACIVTRKKRGLPSGSKCPRTQRLEEIVTKSKQKVEEALIDLSESELKISSEVIQEKFKAYDFLSEKVERKFIKEYATTGKEPEWADVYKLDYEQNVMFLIKNEVVDLREISKDEETRRLMHLYSDDELALIWSDSKMKNVLSDYKESDAFYWSSYESYVALRHFNAEGYLKIGKNSNMARRMRHALYELAVRQMADLANDFPRGLLASVAMPARCFVKNFLTRQRTYTFQQFTVGIMIYKSDHFLREVERTSEYVVFFELHFEDNFFRADLDKVFATSETKTVIFPGSEFEILRVENYPRNRYATVSLKYVDKPELMGKWKKIAARKIEKYSKDLTELAKE